MKVVASFTMDEGDVAIFLRMMKQFNHARLSLEVPDDEVVKISPRAKMVKKRIMAGGKETTGVGKPRRARRKGLTELVARFVAAGGPRRFSDIMEHAVKNGYVGNSVSGALRRGLISKRIVKSKNGDYSAPKSAAAKTEAA